MKEAKAHGVPIEEVHFHEVGAVDSIVDIVAVAVCLDNLDITEVIVPFLCEGRGTVRCQHGILPVPVPAVANILEAHRIPIRFTEVEGELVTPTGAAIVAAVKTGAELPKQFVINRIGIGAGKRNYERPSLLRAMLIQEKNTYQSQSLIENAKKEDFIYKLETNIDDCTGEALGYTMDKLMAAGARDVHFIPVYMKKSTGYVPCIARYRSSLHMERPSKIPPCPAYSKEKKRSSMLMFSVFPKRRGRVIKVTTSMFSHHSRMNAVLST